LESKQKTHISVTKENKLLAKVKHTKYNQKQAQKVPSQRELRGIFKRYNKGSSGNTTILRMLTLKNTYKEVVGA